VVRTDTTRLTEITQQSQQRYLAFLAGPFGRSR
jgi:hypothetical protein